MNHKESVKVCMVKKNKTSLVRKKTKKWGKCWEISSLHKLFAPICFIYLSIFFTGWICNSVIWHSEVGENFHISVMISASLRSLCYLLLLTILYIYIYCKLVCVWFLLAILSCLALKHFKTIAVVSPDSNMSSIQTCTVVPEGFFLNLNPAHNKKTKTKNRV